jgi:hypothetical protein
MQVVNHLHTSSKASVFQKFAVVLIYFSKPDSTGTKKYDRFRGVTGFVRLPLQRNVQQGLKKSADIEGEPVF